MAGVSPKFSSIDVLRVFRIISKNPLSRAEIVRCLGIGEGSVRSILDLLKEQDLIESTRAGHFLSTPGEYLAKEISSRVNGPIHVKCPVFPNPFRAAVVVRKPMLSFDAVKMRDLALKWGADAALVLLMQGGSLRAPKAESKLDLGHISDQLNPDEGNMVILTFAASQQSADTSALAVAIWADDGLKGIVVKKFGVPAQSLPISI
ncbi:MAG: winged helix-turn-helix domain-containing protein [Nanoarchaeota archaeon]